MLCPLKQRSAVEIPLRDLAALREGIQKTLLDVENPAIAIKEDAVLKLVLERTEV